MYAQHHAARCSCQLPHAGSRTSSIFWLDFASLKRLNVLVLLLREQNVSEYERAMRICVLSELRPKAKLSEMQKVIELIDVIAILC